MAELFDSSKLFPADGGGESLYTRVARGALLCRTTPGVELTPRATARAVADALPHSLGCWLLDRLDRLGWLDPRARIPFDILDGSSCPPEFRGGRRELVRLAVFGLPGQGLASRDRHRQDVYQQLCAQIMSSAVDPASLVSVARRAMNHPDVVSDSVLSSMVRSFIAQREAVLRSQQTPEERHAEGQERSKLRRAFDVPQRCDYPAIEETQALFARLQGEFDSRLALFEEVQAELLLDKMRALRSRFPAHIPAADLQACEEQIDALLKRSGVYRRQIKELAKQGSEAAHGGDQKLACWIMRRLQAIHALLPNLLSDEQLEELNAQITHGGEAHETEEASQELIERQNEVASKIKSLASVVHRFHEVAAQLPPEHNAYRRAEVNYRAAIEEIRGLDTDWLSGLVVHLETLLEELDDPDGTMHSNLDRFIASVRTTLNRLCLEIRSWHKGQASGNGGQTPPDDDASSAKSA